MELTVSYGQALLAGLLSFFSPCILPLVPPYLGFIAGVSFNELSGREPNPAARRRVILAAIAFVAGFSVVFVLMGAGASAIGQALQDNMDWLRYVAGAIIILMGLHFLGLLRIGLLYRQAKVEVRSKPVGMFGAFLVGLAFAFGWSPCAGPVLAMILGMASGFGDPIQGGTLLLAYALGIGVPFIIAAAFAASFLKMLSRAGRYMPMIEKAMGVLLVVTGALFMIRGGFATIGQWMYEAAPELWGSVTM